LSDEPISLAGGGAELPESLRRIRARTPARLLVGRAGAAYRTSTQLELREAHAAARDAVWAELDVAAAFGAEFMRRWELFEVRTRAAHKDEYLLRPDLGRQFDEASQQLIRERCAAGRDLQIVIGDGLSATAVAAQVPSLIPLLMSGAERLGWNAGRAFVVHHCRVGILNEIGELLRPSVAVLLIGERPGLATAESLSAYLAYKPEKSHTDANRNLVSNIHARGLSANDAAEQILRLADEMMRQRKSGHQLQAKAQPLISG
jgi:ethanolamine ammonia-lyase small subunit